MIQFLATVVLFVATLTPLANCFDTWDKGPAAPPANDTELNVAMLFAGVGFVLVLPKLVRRIVLPGTREQQTTRRVMVGLNFFCSDRATPIPSASPPLLSLRI